jgi:hypothetical protein
MDLVVHCFVGSSLDVKNGLQGIHLIRHAVFRAAELGCQFVLLGTGHADGDFKYAYFLVKNDSS